MLAGSLKSLITALVALAMCLGNAACACPAPAPHALSPVLSDAGHAHKGHTRPAHRPDTAHSPSSHRPTCPKDCEHHKASASLAASDGGADRALPPATFQTGRVAAAAAHNWPVEPAAAPSTAASRTRAPLRPSPISLKNRLLI